MQNRCPVDEYSGKEKFILLLRRIRRKAKGLQGQQKSALLVTKFEEILNDRCHK